MGRLDNKIKNTASAGVSTNGRLSKSLSTPVTTPVPVSNPSPYFYAKTDPQGGAIGYSQNEYDSSGKPFFAYRNPGDTSTTTDKTRVSTKFDPRVATTTPTESFYNPREADLRNKVSGRLGTKSNEQVDHITALALSGSNDISNLRNWDANKNQANAPVVQGLQSDVSKGRLPLLNAQVENSRIKKIPEPWTPAGQVQPKEGILKKALNSFTGFGQKVSEVLPGVRVGVDAIVNKDASIFTNSLKYRLKNYTDTLKNGVTRDEQGKIHVSPEYTQQIETLAGGFVGGGGSKGKVFSSFHPEDQVFLTKIASDIKAKAPVSSADLKIARETLTTYGHTPPASKTAVASLIEKEKEVVEKARNAISDRQLSTQMDRNLKVGNQDVIDQVKKGRLQPRDSVGRYGNVEKPKTVDGEIMNSGQRKITTPNNTAPITNTSSRIMSDTIPQNKGIVGRLVDKFKNTPNKQGGFARTPDFGDVPNKKTELQITEDVIKNHPAKNLIKYMNKSTGELPQVTGGVKSKFGNRGDDIVTELGYEDTSKLSKSIDEYKNLQAKAKQLRQDVMNERIAKAESTKNARIANQPLKYSAEGHPLALNARERAIASGSQVDIRPSVKSAVSVPTLEKPRGRIQSQGNGEVSSFEKIVQSTPTPVKDKINIIDYVRTPDKVLEKIGLGNEAKFLRKSYEAYQKELPSNIDKITQWSKEVSAEGNKKIFQFLDGQAIDLNPNETKVAGEVKQWLSGWADRLDLPKDNRISHYITHIFDKELIAKEFDEDLAKIIADRIPGSVYDPFLLRRLGAKGYKQDTWQALDAYVKRATRKAHLDPALEQIKSKTGGTLETSKVEASQFKYVQRYVNNVNMRPTELDTVLDNGIKSIVGYKYGQRPITALTKTLRQMTFRGMIGLNPGSALRNISQGINTYATLGEKHTIIGYSKLFSKGAVQELKDVGVLADGFIQDRTLSATRKTIEKADKVLFSLFDTAEKINRGSAYFGAKSKALSQGKTLEQAIEYGKEIVRKTQFNFGSIDTPVALQNDLAKTLLQFQTYTVKQVEFLAGMAKDKNVIGLLRYAVGGLAFTYTIGKAFGMEPEQLIPQFRFDTPPSLKLPVETTKALLNTPDKYGQPRDLQQKASDVGKSAIGLIPAGSQIKKSYEGVKSIQEGGSYDKGGKLQYKQDQSTKGKIQSVLFGKNTSGNAKDYFADKPTGIENTYKKVQDLVTSGKKQEAETMVNALSDVQYEEYKKVKSSTKAKATSEGKRKIMSTFLKVKKLKDQGKESEAQLIVNNLSDEEYKYYQLVKKQNK